MPGKREPGVKPLDGVRVFELSIAIAAPTCGRYLAHFGAEVIKVESLNNPDVLRVIRAAWLDRTRDWHPQTAADTTPGVNEFLAGKLHLGLDLKQEKGREAAHRLLSSCDIFLTNYSAPAVSALGFDDASVRAVKPDIIYVGLSAFGATPGMPYYDYIAWGPNQAPLVGLDDLTGWADRPPSGMATLSYPDYTNGLHGLVATLAALHVRERTGEGQLIDLAQFEATVGLLAPFLLALDQGGAPPARNGNRVGLHAPEGVYPCLGEDRWVAISVYDDADWRALCPVVAHPEWLEDDRFATCEARLAHHDELDEEIARWTSAHADAEVAACLQDAGVAASPVLHPRDVAVDDHLAARRFFLFPRSTRFGRDLTTGNPIRLTETPGGVDRAGPAFGEDTKDVLQRLCGYTPEEVDKMIADGVAFAMADEELRFQRPYVPWGHVVMPHLPWADAQGVAQ